VGKSEKGTDYRVGVIRLLTLTAFVGIMHAVGFLRQPGTPHGSRTLFLGFFLLASYLAGRAARAVSLPQITGYLIIGILLGPYVLGVVPRDVVMDFRFVNGVALALIALSAGGELRIETLRERLRSITTITVLQILIMFTLVALAVYLARGSIEFLRGQPTRVAVAVALVFGLVAVAKSPATTIAVITEERARGLLTDTVLGVTVLKDVLILILIALLIPLATSIMDPAGGFNLHAVWEILLAILGSLSLGTALGWMITLYLWRIRTYRILFVLAVAFLAVCLGDWLDLDFILVAMAAGFYVQNFSRQGRRLLHALEANSLPVYAVFFAVAGADLDITVLRSAWLLATAIVLTRLVALWMSTYIGARMARDPPVIRRSAWMGFLAQAGVTLGIANLVRDRFPVAGVQVATIIVAMIAVNQLIGPPIFRWSLIRAGESRAPSTV
jgi:Kef-type K+ transport system membrane component KefB